MNLTNKPNQAKLRVACVGAGYFSQFHYEAWQRANTVELVAVCDLQIEKARQTAERFEVEKWFDGLEAMLDQCEADIIDVITPPAGHLESVSMCLNAGFDVVCQKPFGENLAQAQQMVNLALSLDRKLIVHENFRFMPWYRHAKKLLAQEVIGEVLNITYKLRPGDGQGQDAYLARQAYFQTMPKLLIHETGIHFVDTFRYLVGEIVDVSARLKKCNPVIAGEDAGVVTFTFENQALGIFDGNRCLDHATDNTRRTMGEMWIEGTRGTIRIDGDGDIWLRKFGSKSESQEKYNWLDKGFGGDCVYNAIQHIVDHYCLGTPLENSATDYLRNIQIEDAIYHSHSTKKVVSV